MLLSWGLPVLVTSDTLAQQKFNHVGGAQPSNCLGSERRMQMTFRRIAFLVALICAILTAALIASPARASWPVAVPGGVEALAIDDTGNIYTTSGNAITKILPDGTLAGGNWPLTVSDTAVVYDLAVDGVGNIYAIDWRGASVSKILPDGTRAGGNWPVRLTADWGPEAIVIDAVGDIYVASETANSYSGIVSKILPDGSQATGSWPVTLPADSAPYDSTSLAVDTSGSIFLIAYEADKVWKILPTGALAGGAWPVVCGSYSVATDGAGNVYCTEIGAIAKILPNGTRADGSWPVSISGGETVVLTLDAAANVYTTAWSAPSVWKILTSGVVDGDTWPKIANSPSDMLIDAAGNLFVANQGNNTVAKMIGVTAPAPPATPAAPSAVSGDHSATVTIVPNSVSARYGAASSYTVRSVQDTAKQCTIATPAVSCVIDGLTNGATYTFTTTANLLAWQTAASAPSNAVAPSSAIAPVTEVVRPATPRNVRWSGPYTTGHAFTATFFAPPATTYTISAAPSITRLAPRAIKTVRGMCSVKTNQKTQKRTARCTIHLKQAGSWLVSVTPVLHGVKGIPATKRVVVRTEPPARSPAATASPVAG